ncbi:MAG TPA: hypothetical protein VMV92_29005 [Streptosporangiaceae bacterium]|nr:hypothetical protein [Streptosporangiaceae bacterium]
MSDTHAEHTSGTDRTTGYRGQRAAAEPTAWVGWVIFAGVVMITLGAFHIIDGLVALFEKSYYAVTSDHLVVHVNYAAWGWTHMAIGVLFVLVGFGVLVGQTWARVVGIALAVISAIVNLAFIASYPVWGVILIALDIVVIYALATHGRELKSV